MCLNSWSGLPMPPFPDSAEITTAPEGTRREAASSSVVPPRSTKSARSVGSCRGIGAGHPAGDGLCTVTGPLKTPAGPWTAPIGIGGSMGSDLEVPEVPCPRGLPVGLGGLAAPGGT